MELSITLDNPQRRLALFGPGDRNLKMIREAFDVQIFAREGQVKIIGSNRGAAKAAAVVEQLQKAIREDEQITPDKVAQALSAASAQGQQPAVAGALDVYVAGQLIKAKTPGQQRYIEAVQTHDMVFCTGPAGTGKTYLAVAIAVHMLKHMQSRRLVLVRPAVEAGEKLGFLPGDLAEKVNPYLRPLYDALHDMMDYDHVMRLIERDTIEVAPLAFMRGRTLNDAFIILDEAQNTTSEQMKMFLTRLGFNSKAVITGDITQIDLPTQTRSGLVEAANILKNIDGLDFVYFSEDDVVRHKLVAKIIKAYEKKESKK